MRAANISDQISGHTALRQERETQGNPMRDTTNENTTALENKATRAKEASRAKALEQTIKTLQGDIHEQTNPKIMHRHLCRQIKNGKSQRKLQEQVPEPNMQMVYANKRNPTAYPK